MGLAPVAQITSGCIREHSSIWLWSWGKAIYYRTLFTCRYRSSSQCFFTCQA